MARFRTILTWLALVAFLAVTFQNCDQGAFNGYRFGGSGEPYEGLKDGNDPVAGPPSGQAPTTTCQPETPDELIVSVRIIDRGNLGRQTEVIYILGGKQETSLLNWPQGAAVLVPNIPLGPDHLLTRIEVGQAGGLVLEVINSSGTRTVGLICR